MDSKFFRVLAVSVACVPAMFAQNRQASIVGGGSPDRGKCTVEVVVDGAAEVEIRGAVATLRTTNGQQAQWRRFECSSAMPANPPNFHFAGVDGRGRQDLIREPNNGGAAVIRIEDRDNGSEGYTFDITWEARGPVYGGNPNGGPNVGGRQDDRNRGDDRYRPNYRDSEYYRRYGHGFEVEEAIRVCQQSVLNQATRRFRTRDVHFNRTTIDNNPGRNDWVVGTLDAYRGGREERYGFSCSVNFDNGTVRSATLDPRPVVGDRR